MMFLQSRLTSVSDTLPQQVAEAATSAASLRMFWWSAACELTAENMPPPPPPPKPDRRIRSSSSSACRSKLARSASTSLARRLFTHAPIRSSSSACSASILAWPTEGSSRQSGHAPSSRGCGASLHACSAKTAFGPGAEAGLKSTFAPSSIHFFALAACCCCSCCCCCCGCGGSESCQVPYRSSRPSSSPRRFSTADSRDSRSLAVAISCARTRSTYSNAAFPTLLREGERRVANRPFSSTMTNPWHPSWLGKVGKSSWSRMKLLKTDESPK
mmetsp:Transcript_3746/g.8544  ORF Transcript_3746/g.8544 Transcript_3746/m.8544 type:complete len:272 (-) Transcript_3746:477-1292(-)